jgi:sigma-B regulation protein RsbU (phosphoserine phosphatase)
MLNADDLTKEQLLEELQSLHQQVANFKNEKAAFSIQRTLLETLLTTVRTSSEGGLIRAALQKTLDLSADLTGSETGSLFLIDPSSEKIVDAILSRTEVTAEQRQRLIGNVLDKGLAGWVRRHRQVGLIADTENDERWLTLPNQPYVVRSALAIPILSDQDLLGIITLLHSVPGYFNPEISRLMQIAANQMALVLDNAQLYAKLDAYSKALDLELEKGREIQLNFLPDEILQPEDWEIAACFYPAKQVAGDFYDAFPLPGGYVGFVIADVCDKGVGAALFMALFRSLIRIFSGQTALQGLSINAETEEESAELHALQAIEMTNNYIAINHWQMSMFATLFFGVLNPETGVVSYINGGHEPLFILNETGIRESISSTGPAVGMMPDMIFKVKQLQLQPGEILVGYTDGVTEAKDPEGHLFSPQRLKELIEQPTDSAQGLLDRIYKALFDYIEDAPQFDDITMIAIKRR